MSRLLQHLFERSSGPHVPHLVFRQGNAAELTACCKQGIVLRHPCRQSLLGRELDVDAKFAIEVVILCLAPAPETEISHSGRCYCAGSMTRPMALASRRHFECSLASRFLPAGVNR